ncbi:hypothetical protein CAAN3_11S00848 [[Candida] anglica]
MSIFSISWNEVTTSGSIPLSQLPIFLEKLESNLIQSTNLKDHPISNDPFISQKLSLLMNQIQDDGKISCRDENIFLSQEQVIQLINTILIDLKFIDLESQNAYGSFNNDHEYYCDDINTITNKKEQFEVFDEDLDIYSDSELDSVMDIISSSPSLYEEDTGSVQFYIRDSLYEIDKHHARIQTQLGSCEEIVEQLRKHSLGDLQCLDQLQKRNEVNHDKLFKLKLELNELEILLMNDKKDILLKREGLNANSDAGHLNDTTNTFLILLISITLMIISHILSI